MERYSLRRRNWEPKQNAVKGFTARHRIHDLVWYEQHESIESPILRKKAIKAWKRAWKIELIERANPRWRDLCPELL